MNTDIIIVGGGASGYAAAITAKKNCPAAKVAILERLQRTGKKIIATGNGKCNLSNMNLSAERFHGSVDAMRVIESMPDCYDFFTKELGILCVTGSEGREGGIYPRSNSSSTVLNALRMKTAALGIEEICECEIKEIIPQKNSYRLIAKNKEEYYCNALIIAAGGYAAPSFGTDGSMLRILKDMGYRTSKICPAVAPLKVSQEQLKGLKGVRVKGDISAVSDGRKLHTEHGEIQFNENTVSGICVFNLAWLYQQYEGKLSLCADLMPDVDFPELVEYIKDIRKIRSENTLEELLTGVFLKNLAVYLVKNTLHRPMTELIGTVTDKEIKSLAKAVKNLEFTVTGCSSWQNAQSTMGGITNDCINPDLSSKLHKNMFFCGEILDVAGDCGGFNLQWAWSSGMLAGKSCAEALKGNRYGKNK